MFGGRIGMMELLLIAGVAMLLFGKRLPTIGKSLGEGIRNFKKGLSEDDKQTEVTKDPVVPVSQSPQIAQSVNPSGLRESKGQVVEGERVEQKSH